MESQIIDKKDPEIQKILMDCMYNTAAFSKTFFPGIVFSPFSSLHDTIISILDDKKKKKKAIAAPRGIGKTTLTKLRVCRAILFREVNFIIYLSNSATMAEMQTEDIKRMLRSTELIRALFGDIKIKSEILDDSFSKKSWTAFGEVFILPRGAGQQVRGLNWKSNRPGLVVVDDLEDKDEIINEDNREKLSNWFHSDLEKTESKFGEPAEFDYIDTIKHEDSQLQRLIDSSDWYSTTLSICDDNFKSFDENYMTTEEIKDEYEKHREKGKTDLFYMEYMNIPISLRDAVFKPELFKYYTECGDHVEVINAEGKKDKILSHNLVNVIIVDPAKTVNLQSAESAVIAIGVSRQDHKIFIRDVFSERVKPDGLYDAIFDFVLRFKAAILAVEVTSLHEFISQPIENEMRVRGIFTHYVELNAKGKKPDRVKTLAPLYRLGYIYHNKNACTKLEHQLQWFPRSKLWDVMDGTSYITKIMDEHFIYFDPSEGDDPDEPDEYEDIEDDEAIEHWGII